MSYRDALKVFKLERELSDDETAFLNTLRSMSETERELTVAALSPATPKRSTKKASKKAAGKSARAASLGTQLQQVRHAPDAVCAFVYNDGKPCGQGWANAVHDENAGYAGYHKYEPATTTAKDDNYQEQAGAATGD